MKGRGQREPAWNSFVCVTGTIVGIDEPRWRAGSIGGESYSAELRLECRIVLSNWSGRTVNLRYDVNGLSCSEFSVEDEIDLIIGLDGSLIDVAPEGNLSVLIRWN